MSRVREKCVWKDEETCCNFLSRGEKSLSSLSMYFPTIHLQLLKSIVMFFDGKMSRLPWDANLTLYSFSFLWLSQQQCLVNYSQSRRTSEINCFIELWFMLSVFLLQINSCMWLFLNSLRNIQLAHWLPVWEH